MFKKSVIRSFHKVKDDVTALKKGVTGWIVHYNEKHELHEKRLELLEQRIVYLERQLLEKRW